MRKNFNSRADQISAPNTQDNIVIGRGVCKTEKSWAELPIAVVMDDSVFVVFVSFADFSGLLGMEKPRLPAMMWSWTTVPFALSFLTSVGDGR
jgi:hypothetical protein